MYSIHPVLRRYASNKIRASNKIKMTGQNLLLSENKIFETTRFNHAMIFFKLTH